jgi:hypothetical protein
VFVQDFSWDDRAAETGKSGFASTLQINRSGHQITSVDFTKLINDIQARRYSKKSRNANNGEGNQLSRQEGRYRWYDITWLRRPQKRKSTNRSAKVVRIVGL